MKQVSNLMYFRNKAIIKRKCDCDEKVRELKVNQAVCDRTDENRFKDPKTHKFEDLSIDNHVSKIFQSSYVSSSSDTFFGPAKSTECPVVHSDRSGSERFAAKIKTQLDKRAYLYFQPLIELLCPSANIKIKSKLRNFKQSQCIHKISNKTEVSVPLCRMSQYKQFITLETSFSSRCPKLKRGKRKIDAGQHESGFGNAARRKNCNRSLSLKPEKEKENVDYVLQAILIYVTSVKLRVFNLIITKVNYVHPIDDKFLVDAAYRGSYMGEEKVKESAKTQCDITCTECNLFTICLRDGNMNVIGENDYKKKSKSEVHHFAFSGIVVNHDEESTANPSKCMIISSFNPAALEQS
ncbi:hypothetical protein WN51_02376 [Melipona quadrifasciata]|uniref:Uncharacterized protein n=1 Tax=Melipona quadrifasciata TaxID=166423 RepID=A0A0M8ZX20_9HYME|nr:hypothetical protein WN51_02376 [Melipona quadrifasciata]